MIEFKKITLEDKAWMTQKMKEDDRRGCEFSFGNNFIWRNVYQVEVTELYACLVVKFDADGDDCLSFPVGNGDKQRAIEALIADAAEKKQVLQFENILEEDKQLLEEHFPGQFVVNEVRDGFDYIYSREKLATLAGKKLHGKRNHINRFMENNNWTYEPMTSDNKYECLKMNESWCDKKACDWNQGMKDEFCAVQESVKYFEELGFVGGVIRVDGEIVAFTIGEPLNSDTFVVHIEKAFPDIQGAYPMINQQFVQRECPDFLYVNREDDTGSEGLRKAKLSYYPDILLKKYSAEYVG